MIGEKYGKWTVVSLKQQTKEEKIKSHYARYYICKCECGSIGTVSPHSLRNGKSRQCWECRKKTSDTESYIGKTFGKWLVLGIVANPSMPGQRLLCQCECGSQNIIRKWVLNAGASKCKKCAIAEESAKLTKHGATYTKEWKIWSLIKRRCYAKERVHYKYYGARGIKVCDRWLASFSNFYEDMGDCPKGLQIDRIDNNGNYEKSNCKWSTAKENVNNRRCSPKNKISKDQLSIASPD